MKGYPGTIRDGAVEGGSTGGGVGRGSCDLTLHRSRCVVDVVGPQGYRLVGGGCEGVGDSLVLLRDLLDGTGLRFTDPSVLRFSEDSEN